MYSRLFFAFLMVGILPGHCRADQQDELKRLKDELQALQKEVRQLREESKGLRQEVRALRKRVEDEADGYLGLKVVKGAFGAVVTGVAKGSPAEKAGFQEGDIISAVEDKNIRSVEDFRQAVGNLKPGDQITITGGKSGHMHRIVVTLGKRP